MPPAQPNSAQPRAPPSARCSARLRRAPSKSSSPLRSSTSANLDWISNLGAASPRAAERVAARAALPRRSQLCSSLVRRRRPRRASSHTASKQGGEDCLGAPESMHDDKRSRATRVRARWRTFHRPSVVEAQTKTAQTKTVCMAGWPPRRRRAARAHCVIPMVTAPLDGRVRASARALCSSTARRRRCWRLNALASPLRTNGGASRKSATAWF